MFLEPRLNGGFDFVDFTHDVFNIPAGICVEKRNTRTGAGSVAR